MVAAIRHELGGRNQRGHSATGCERANAFFAIYASWSTQAWHASPHPGAIADFSEEGIKNDYTFGETLSKSFAGLRVKRNPDGKCVLLRAADAERFHFAIKMAALKAQDFRRAADVAVVLIQLAKDVVALIGGARFMQG